MTTKKEWWMPCKNPPEEWEGLAWHCDHLGDATDVMDRMWKRLCQLDSTLPLEGFPEEE